MIAPRVARLGLLALVACAAWALGQAQADNVPRDTRVSPPDWRQPGVDVVRDQVFEWLDRREVEASIRSRIEAIWAADVPEPAGSELLVRLAASFALVDENAARLVAVCSKPRDRLAPPSADWLAAGEAQPLVAHNLRLLFGRWLVHQAWFDEAETQLAGLDPGDVVDPASLLFYQAVVHHRLLDREKGLEAVRRLLAGADACPGRYVAVGRLMEQDLIRLKEESLDHIARRMEDIERRLDLGRAGSKVRDVEDGVIESLDKLIKRIEQQQQQQCGAGGNSIQSSSPAPDSRILGGKGPGEVTKRAIGEGSGWGDLPPKQREEALQQIGRDLPSHYRDVIEQYFRKLAGEPPD
jgi:hypothetical protein